MKKFLNILMLAVATLLVACNPNNDNGGEKEPLKVNTYSVNGKVAALKSVAVMMVGDNLSIVATPTADISSGEAILECEEYLFAAVSPLLVGREFDLKTEPLLYTLISTIADAKLETVAPGLTDEIVSGKAKFTYVNNTLNVSVEATLVSGTTLAFVAEAEQEVKVNENKIARGNEEKPLRAAFYMEEEGMTALYFTPAGVEYFSELEDASWLLYIMVSSDMVNGERVDLSTITSDKLFMFGYVDNVFTDKSFNVLSGKMLDATGHFTLAKKGEGVYAADIEIEVDGTTYSVSFDDVCTSALLEPEKKTNYLLFENVEYLLSSAKITKGTDYWSVDFAVSNGKTLTLTAPENFFAGNACGFSQSPYLTVVYDGVTYSKANGSSGTLTAKYTESSAELVVDFTNYDNLIFNYTGVVTIE
jgi:hypothetical protein